LHLNNATYNTNFNSTSSGGFRGGAWGAWLPPPLILGKKKKKSQKEEKPAGQAEQNLNPLSSRSGSATD